MNPNIRASVARVAAEILGYECSPAVYDYTQGLYITFEGEISKAFVDIQDCNHNVHLTGLIPHLRDEKGDAAVTLRLDGTEFQGFDHASKEHYHGSFLAGLVTIFDCESGQYHHFNV